MRQFLRQGRESAEKRCIRKGPADVLARELGRRHGENALVAKRAEELVDTELLEAA